VATLLQIIPSLSQYAAAPALSNQLRLITILLRDLLMLKAALLPRRKQHGSRPGLTAAEYNTTRHQHAAAAERSGSGERHFCLHRHAPIRDTLAGTGATGRGTGKTMGSCILLRASRQ